MRFDLDQWMPANGMVRPYSRPASNECWQGTEDNPSERLANELRPFCASNRSSLLRQFTRLVKLRTTPRPEIPAAAKRCRQHGRAHYGRGRRIRLDRTALGIHDFWCTTAVRRTPTIGCSGVKR